MKPPAGTSRLPTEAFWMVYGIDQGPPTRRHDRRHLAVAEMKRLASAYPGTAFVLLEAVGAAVKDDIKTVVFGNRDNEYLSDQETDDDIPF